MLEVGAVGKIKRLTSLDSLLLWSPYGLTGEFKSSHRDFIFCHEGTKKISHRFHGFVSGEWLNGEW